MQLYAIAISQFTMLQIWVRMFRNISGMATSLMVLRSRGRLHDEDDEARCVSP